jgi:hypothetical protein
MNDLIQSLPSPSAYSGDYPHMDGGIMNGWWRGVGDDDGDDLLQFPVPAWCQNGASGSELGFLIVAAQRNSLWKNVKPTTVFRSGALYMPKEVSRRWPRRPHHPQARPRVARAARWCGPLVAHLRLVFWLRESSGKIGILQYFLGIFLKVWFLHKNETPEQLCWKQR